MAVARYGRTWLLLVFRSLDSYCVNMILFYYVKYLWQILNIQPWTGKLIFPLFQIFPAHLNKEESVLNILDANSKGGSGRHLVCILCPNWVF